MNGARELFDYLCKNYEASAEEMTADGRFTFSKVECLDHVALLP